MGVTEDGEIDSETSDPYHVLLLVRAHGVHYIRELNYPSGFCFSGMQCCVIG